MKQVVWFQSPCWAKMVEERREHSKVNYCLPRNDKDERTRQDVGLETIVGVFGKHLGDAGWL